MQPTKSLTLTAVYEEDENGWVSARVLEIPGANTCAKSREEARAMLEDAVRELVLSYVEDEETSGRHGASYEPLEVTLV